MTVAREKPMIRPVLNSINLRSTILTALGTTLLLSLICSLSLQAGHADVPIAESAEAIRPLGAGEKQGQIDWGVLG